MYELNVLTCGSGDGADEDRRDGHQDTADGGHVRENLGSGRRLARQHPLEVHLQQIHKYILTIDKIYKIWLLFGVRLISSED